MSRPGGMETGAKIAPFWEVLGERPIGFTLVTAAGDEPAGFVGLSVAHVSAEPPLLSVALDARNKALEPIERSGSFAINFLSAANEAVARAFMKRGASAAERFRPENWTTLATGSPVLLDGLGVFDCQVERIVDLDHTRLLVGRVVGSWASGEGAPLVFFRGAFRPMASEG